MSLSRLMLLLMSREMSREVPLLGACLVKASDLLIELVLVVLVAWTSTLQRREILQLLAADRKIMEQGSK